MDRDTAINTNLTSTTDAIAVLRALGWAVTKLAAEAGVHRSTIYRWAHGIRRPADPRHRARLDAAACRAQKTAKAEQAKRTPLTWKTTRGGERVICGPTATVKVGPVQIGGKTETVARLGRVFEVDGVDMVYGYTNTQTATPRRPVGNGRCLCGCGGWLTEFDRTASAVGGYKFDCA